MEKKHEFQVPKMEVITEHEVRLFWGVGKLPVHKPYPYSLYDGA